MSKKATKILGPITFEMKVHMTNDEKGLVGSASYSFTPGCIPTPEDVVKGIAAALKTVGPGWLLMTPNDFFNRVIVKEATGRAGNFAVPNDFAYERDSLQAVVSQIDVGGEEE